MNDGGMVIPKEVMDSDCFMCVTCHCICGDNMCPFCSEPMIVTSARQAIFWDYPQPVIMEVDK